MSLEYMTVAELKDTLREIGLSPTGNKAELTKRLKTEMAESALAIDTPTPPPEVSKELVASSQSAAAAVVDEAKSIAITGDSEYSAAGQFLTDVVRPPMREISSGLDPIVSMWNKGHKATIALKKRLMDPFVAAEGIIKKEMGKWTLEVQRRQREEQRKLEAAMQAEAERMALEEAQSMLEDGDVESAQAILESLANGEVEPTTPAPPMVKVKPKAEGTSVRMLRRFRVLDPGKVKRAYLMVDERAIQQAVDIHGKGAEEVVGKGSIEYYEEPNIAARR